MLPSLNTTELHLIESMELGTEADLTGMAEPLRVDVLRHLLLQLPDPVLPEWAHTVPKARWKIRGATFDKRLDLSDARGKDGGSLAACTGG